MIIQKGNLRHGSCVDLDYTKNKSTFLPGIWDGNIPNISIPFPKGVRMFRSNSIMSRFCAGTMFLAFCLIPAMHSVGAESNESTPVYSPVVNGEALRGLSTIGSAESMGAGRITFDLLVPWYQQRIAYLNAPNADANIFTGAGAFSYGVNSHVDLFASVAGFGSSNYVNTNRSYGLGTIRAGAQGSLPFPSYSFVRMGGQLAIIGGTSQNQINTYRADGYNYFETRTGYDLMGKLMQTVRSGSEDWGFKLHLNEAGVVDINKSEPALLLLGAGVQGNLGFMVLGAEINSRTRVSDMSFGTDPLWFTPSLHIRTPYQMNAMVGIDVSLSEDRSNNNPRALEPYRVFGALAFSFDMLAGRRNAEFARRHKAEQDLAAKTVNDSIALANEKNKDRMHTDAMQRQAYDNTQANKAAIDALAAKAIADSIAAANTLAAKTTADSLALLQSANDLAYEKGKRSDAEKQLLSTGELLLDAVYFKTGKTDISINSKPYLNIIGKMLLKYPKLQIEVAGHTDNVGGVDYNVGLSQGRAEAVHNYLTIAYPALNSTLSAHGYGMSKPKADNNTKDGRKSNRRVELRVMNKDALLEYSQVW
jgi:outer membrane protein OmpA-like peptidoglycan-associated protein